MELNRSSKTTDSEGIPLKLPRRVRRRVGELPFEWLRQIARRSHHVSESSSPSTDSDFSDDSEHMSEDEKVTSPSEAPSTSKPASAGSALTPGAHVLPPNAAALAHRSPHGSPFSSPAMPARSHRGTPSSPTSSAHSRSPPDADELTRTLESQFYKIELGEQKRLLGVMERHSMESGKVIQEGHGMRGRAGIPTPKGVCAKSLSGAAEDAESAAAVGEEAIASFPYSITAGLEKGAKNRCVRGRLVAPQFADVARYRHIWPFEHARVRLRKCKPDDDDYMNASYVQPLGTTKRYIATQGPLPATFADFWKCVHRCD